MQPSDLLRRYCPLVFLAALAIFSWKPATGQDPKRDDEEVVIESKEKFDGNDRSEIQKLQNGKPMTSSSKQLLERAAKAYVYRLTYPQFQERLPPEGGRFDQAKSVSDISQELFSLFVFPDPSRSIQPNQQLYMHEFTTALIEPVERVLQNAKPIARINAAIVLARLGETGDETLVKPLLKILKDKNQNDAVKVWALRGLKNVFRAKNTPDVDRFKDTDDVADYIRDMLDFLGRKPDLPANAMPEEVEAFKYVRREAIRAVAQTRYPAIEKKKAVLGRPALELLRIMRNDGINPEPRFDEQVEAAIGVCLMKPRLYPNYQVQFALQQLGLFYLDFADKYEKERNKQAKSFPWQYESVRLQQALATLDDVDASDADKKAIKGFVAEAKGGILKPIQEKGATSVDGVRRWLGKNQLPANNNTLYKGEKDATIKTETTN
jgi:hypothetical protein